MSDAQRIKGDLRKVDPGISYIADLVADYYGAFSVRVVTLDDEDAAEAKISPLLRSKYGMDLLSAYWEDAGVSLPPNDEMKAAAILLKDVEDVNACGENESFAAYGNLAQALKTLVEVGVLTQEDADPLFEKIEERFLSRQSGVVIANIDKGLRSAARGSDEAVIK